MEPRAGEIEAVAAILEEHGHASAVLGALQAWYRELDIPAASLVASEMAEPLYREHGFIDEPFGQPLIWFSRPAQERTG